MQEFRTFVEADTCLFEEAMGHFKDKVELVKVVEPNVDRGTYWNFRIKEGDKPSLRRRRGWMVRWWPGT